MTWYAHGPLQPGPAIDVIHVIEVIAKWSGRLGEHALLRCQWCHA
ncbi:hypothetical protein [Actinacidiphila rubida]|nr:hypothetical protein [Actinacidiphila rubida]